MRKLWIALFNSYRKNGLSLEACYVLASRKLGKKTSKPY